MKASYTTISKGVLAVLLACVYSACTSAQPVIKRGDTSKSFSPEEEPEAQVLTIRYSNQSTSIKMDVDPFDEDLYIDMRGGRHKVTGQEALEPAKPIIIRDTIREEQKGSEPNKSQDKPQEGMKSPEKLDPAKANDKVLAQIRKAQEFFYKNQYEDALDAVNKSLQIQPTAEGYALMGSIYYMMAENEWAIHNWRNALDMNPDMVEIQKMLEKIQRDQE
mgnify:CR=1 FL=1